jgi:hypothetical protein
MTRVGLDIGFTTGSVIIWTVFAKTTATKGCSPAPTLALRQKMSLAASLGANVLVGGSSQTVALQPKVRWEILGPAPVRPGSSHYWPQAPAEPRTTRPKYGFAPVAKLVKSTYAENPAADESKS